MIIRDRPSGLKLFLLLRGSVLPRILPTLIVNIVIATLVTVSHGDLYTLKITLTTIPFTLIGLPIAIFLGFRNNAAYDRFWEGRKLWGELVLRCRNLSRQCQSLIDDPEPAVASLGLADVRVRMIYRAIAFSLALRDRLRNQPITGELQTLLLPGEWEHMEAARNKPDFLMLRMGQDLRLSLKEGRIDPCLAVAIDTTLSAMTAAAASCERIRNTPIPFSYTLLLHRTAYIYCFLLPFGLVDSIGFMTPFVVAVVAYTFFGLDALGDEIEEPFGTESNDLPLDAICRAIEIDMRASLQDTSIPPPLMPINFCLT
ncbi:bestrophin family protein [Actimicrobium sp. CCI2.3]|uniref:bestrophin family protein n=1 Tax=Actimicrobium sp. CCI2.3 TaxID=3048616 RepID=UPI002AB435FB|nr:bestrophin family protein [Actimicrobium sp. CCI2.3]MDY7575193.1 bestrophin family protein [Actimicrobium sp. CCI2.3]MEB0022344.1 bestrophin family protein [Actimicrobium sp. CCI2.3]